MHDHAKHVLQQALDHDTPESYYNAAPIPWQCDECGHVNSPDSPVCLCYFWDDETIREIDNWTERHREPAPDLSHWLNVSIQEGAE